MNEWVDRLLVTFPELFVGLLAALGHSMTPDALAEKIAHEAGVRVIQVKRIEDFLSVCIGWLVNTVSLGCAFIARPPAAVANKLGAVVVVMICLAVTLRVANKGLLGLTGSWKAERVVLRAGPFGLYVAKLFVLG